MVGDRYIIGNIHHKCLLRRNQQRRGVVARHKSRSQANDKLVGDRKALVPEWRRGKRVSSDRFRIVDQNIEMTLLGFHLLEDSPDLPVMPLIALNGDADTA